MKAKIKLKYRDDSEWEFGFSSEDPEEEAGILLRMVCRGALFVSMAHEVIAYDEAGNEVFSNLK